MTANVVQVTGEFGSRGEGNYLFAASGTLMDSTDVAIVTPVVNGVLDPNGNFTACLLASDNYSAGALTWNCFIRVQGMPLIHVTDFAVNYANGATQNLFTILTAAGWTPETTP